MNINDYITHLELRKKGLKYKISGLQKQSSTMNIKKNKERDKLNFDELTDKRCEVQELNSKIEFYKKLKEAIINEEVQQINRPKTK